MYESSPDEDTWVVDGEHALVAWAALIISEITWQSPTLFETCNPRERLAAEATNGSNPDLTK